MCSSLKLIIVLILITLISKVKIDKHIVRNVYRISARNHLPHHQQQHHYHLQFHHHRLRLHLRFRMTVKGLWKEKVMKGITKPVRKDIIMLITIIEEQCSIWISNNQCIFLQHKASWLVSLWAKSGLYFIIIIINIIIVIVLIIYYLRNIQTDDLLRYATYTTVIRSRWHIT